MLSPSVIIPPSPLSHAIPKLKLKHFHETLHLGDAMKIIALDEKGYKAQLIGTGIEVLLVQGPDTPTPSDDSPPATSRSLPPSTSRRSNSLPSPSRSISQPYPSRSLEGLDLGELHLSPRNSSAPLPLTILYPRNKPRRMAASSSPRAQSSPTSPRSSSPFNHILAPPIPPSSRSPPRQRRNGKPLVQVC
jgi:hypothetical protein